MRRRRGGRGHGGAGVQATGPASIAAGGNIINPKTHIDEVHVQEPSPKPGDVEYTAKALAQQVELQWKTEAVLRSLDDPDPIPVRWRFRPSLSDHPANVDPVVIGGPVSRWEGASSGDIAGLAGRFRSTRRRRLVIVDGPGSGKTTLAVQLLLHLLKTRLPGEPVPVLVPVSGWDTGRFPKLHNWLEDRLPRDYPALRSAEHAPALHALVAGSHILPVLDGLDELPADAQAEVIAALNRSLGGDDQFILTSRTTQFREAVVAAGDVLTSSAVLQARPLPPATVADYLRVSLPPDPGPAWRRVLDGMRASPPVPTDGTGPWAVLASITATPLGVWLLRTVYTAPGADPAELADPGRFPDPPALRAHLFDRLAAALIATRPPADDPSEPFRPRRQHDPGDAERWLGFLADFLTSEAGTRDLAWWLLTSAAFNPPEPPFTMGTHNYIPGYYSNWSPPAGWADARLVALNLTLSGRTGALCRKLALNLPIGLGFGILCAIFLWFTGRSAVIPASISIAITSWLPAALTEWSAVPVSTADPTTPMKSWRAARAMCLFQRYTTVLAAGLTSGLTFGLAFGWLAGFAFALPAGAVYGCMLAYMMGEDDAWPRYVKAARGLKKRYGLPRDLVGFLDDAHRLGLLRIVGPIYQFRHAQYHDHLATRYRYGHP